MAEARKLETMEELDEALREIGELDRQLQDLEVQMNERIDEVKASAKESAEPIADTRKRLVTSVEGWLKAHRRDFGQQRSRQLQFGSVGFRLVTSIGRERGLSEEQVVAALKAHGLDCIKVKETVDKEAAERLEAEQLALVGLKRAVKDQAWWKVHAEKIRDVTA